mgnify:CR=1 FL=1
MSDTDPFPPAQTIPVGDVALAVHRAGPAPGQTPRPPVVLLHGWPEIAFSWRYQLPALAAAGYPVIVPDQRGYGGADKPGGVENYTMARLTGDIAGLLDALDIDKAVIVGHDWGALVTWAMPFYQPDRVRALAGLNLPFLPRPAAAPTSLLRSMFGDTHYIVRFQTEGACEPILEADLDRTLRFFLRRPRSDRSGDGGGAFSVPNLDLIGRLQGDAAQWPGEEFLSESDLAVYRRAFAAGGMTAPLHWYRNLDANWEDMARFQPVGGPTAPLPYPALIMTAERDAACPPRLADGMERFFAATKRIDFDSVGHWLQQERPDAVNEALLAWLAEH